MEIGAGKKNMRKKLIVLSSSSSIPQAHLREHNPSTKHAMEQIDMRYGPPLRHIHLETDYEKKISPKLSSRRFETPALGVKIVADATLNR
jgi:hypothetical protein